MNKPKCKLIGEDGNIFNLTGITSKTLINNGKREDADKMVKEIIKSKSYEEALCILDKYVDIY